MKFCLIGYFKNYPSEKKQFMGFSSSYDPYEGEYDERFNTSMLSVSSYSLKEVIKNFDRKFLFFVETDDGLAMFVPKFLAKILLWKATREEEKFIERSYKKSMWEYPYDE